MLFCPACANLLVISSTTGYNKWACNTCAYEFPITKQVCPICGHLVEANEALLQMTSRTKLKRKEIDDVLGGDEMWAHADKTMGTFLLFLSNPCGVTNVRDLSNQPDEDFINKSLLDSLDAQADAEPISSSDSEQAPHSYGSVSASNSSSGGGSPPVPYHIAMQAHHQPLAHPDSPETLHHQHISPHDSLYSQQNTMFSPDSLTNIHPDYVAEHELRKYPHQQHKLDGFSNNFRNNGFNQFNPTRTRHQAARSGMQTNNSLRDTPQYFSPTAPEVFSPVMTSPIQQHIPPFESRASYDFSGQMNMGNLAPKLFTDVFPSQNVHPSHQGTAGKVHQQQQPYPPYPHLSSQTPYGPHLPAAPAAVAPLTSGNTNGSLSGPGLTHSSQNASSNIASNPSGNNEEISTIFVVGFPDDMQEREFQNMFTFSPDFEAATLKIPNKEYTAYSGVAGSGSAAGRNPFSGFTGANDPYNMVTVNQGGVVVDGGRDGAMASWPATVPDELNGPFGTNAQSMNMPPRKQIIGFAKFKTREAALLARDGLQGRRVDIDKGAVLKAEMAKKNLHTKRGVGPVPSGTVTSSTSPTAPPAASALQQVLNGGADQLVLGQNEPQPPRDRDLNGVGAMAFNSGRLGQWRDQPQLHHNSSFSNGLPGSDREEDERRAVINGAVLSTLGGSTRGPRERAEEEERERRRRDKDLRSRNGTLSAYEAFHSVPPGNAPMPSSRQLAAQSGTGLPPPSEHDAVPGTSPLTNGFSNSRSGQNQEELPGPWDNIRSGGVPIPRTTSQHSLSSPHPLNGFDVPPRSFSPPTPHQFLEQSRQEPQYIALRNHAASESGSSSGGPQSVGHGGSDGMEGGDLARTLDGLDLNVDGGKTSPQLPSPASGASSRNGVDQNPPINTLYVGNLPTSSPPNGFPQDYLEDSLRELFSVRAGFRRLCFRQKSNGPMCFVEFEDVAHATKALNELYGDTLKGLVKGGIRLSFSKNPLGVRTPTTAGSNGPSLQQQQLLNNNPTSFSNAPGSGQEFLPRKEEHQSRVPAVILRRDSSLAQPPPAQSPFGPELLGTSPPPPRFFSSSPNGFPPQSGPNLAAAAKPSFMPRYALGVPQNSNQGQPSSFSPFGLSSTPPPHHIIPDLQSEGHLSSSHFHSNFAPTSNIEAALAG
ncbi:hypothetical protein H0H93_010824 [Arthromyces matolae]|nr:hypothetical protein H0H93_010824 [Arthromyces matolae]